MRFWDREKEVKDLKAHIESEPNSILFVYGPKSGGKSTYTAPLKNWRVK